MRGVFAARFAAVCAAAGFVVVLGGCTTHRDLLITEIGLTQVELMFNEPPDHRMSLVDHELRVEGSDGTSSVLDLSVFGRSLDGGEFVVVWASPGYTGAPTPSQYTNWAQESRPGIMVREDFFGNAMAGSGVAYSYRIEGEHKRGNITDKTDSVVRLGPVAVRPQIGGRWTDTGDLDPDPRTEAVGVLKATTASRKWHDGEARDRDTEADWKDRGESFGRANDPPY